MAVTNKITLKSLYNTYSDVYKPASFVQTPPALATDSERCAEEHKVERVLVNQREWLNKRYEEYAEDYKLDHDGLFFTKMLEAIDDGLTECEVFTEYPCLLTDIHEEQLESLFARGIMGKPSLYSILHDSLNNKEFDIELIVHKNKKVVVRVFWV